MINSGKRTHWLCIGILCIVFSLIGVIVGILVWENQIERQFPMWETPCLEADNISRFDPDVKLAFTGIDFDIPLRNGDICDQVLIKLKGVPGQSISYGHLTWVDYYYNEGWHTVWSNESTTLSTQYISGSDVTEEEITIWKSVPSGLFVRDGQYRMFIDGLGYCGIDIIGMDSMK